MYQRDKQGLKEQKFTYKFQKERILETQAMIRRNKSAQRDLTTTQNISKNKRTRTAIDNRMKLLVKKNSFFFSFFNFLERRKSESWKALYNLVQGQRVPIHLYISSKWFRQTQRPKKQKSEKNPKEGRECLAHSQNQKILRTGVP